MPVYPCHIYFFLSFCFVTRAILKGLTLRKFMFDVCVYMFYFRFVYGIDFVDLTWRNIDMIMRRILKLMCICLIVLRWPCAVDRTINRTMHYPGSYEKLTLSCLKKSETRMTKTRHCHANSLPSDVTVMLTVYQATSLSCQQSSKRRHCHANSLPSTGHSLTKNKKQKNKKKKNLRRSISGLAFHLIFHRFSQFNCCLSVVS